MSAPTRSLLDAGTGELVCAARSPSSSPARAHHRPQGRRLRHRPRRRSAGTTPTTWPATASSFLLYGLLDYSSTGTSARSSRSTSRSRRSRTCSSTTAPRQHRDVQRRSFQLRKSLVLLRRIVLPMREVVNTLHAPGPAASLDRADGALLPGRLRPRHPRDRVDRVAAGPRHHDRRDQPHRSRATA